LGAFSQFFAQKAHFWQIFQVAAHRPILVGHPWYKANFRALIECLKCSKFLKIMKNLEGFSDWELLKNRFV
jgi:hypothetical protein